MVSMQCRGNLVPDLADAVMLRSINGLSLRDYGLDD